MHHVTEWVRRLTLFACGLGALSMGFVLVVQYF